MASSLHSTEKQLELEMKKNSISQSLYDRPTPAELKEMLPGVYEGLSEEAKEHAPNPQTSALFRVYASLLLSTAEQLMIIGKVRGGGGRDG